MRHIIKTKSLMGYRETINKTISELSKADDLKGIFQKSLPEYLMPNGERIKEIISLSRALLFPGFYGKTIADTSSLSYYIGVDADKLFSLLSEQIEAGLSFQKTQDNSKHEDLKKQASHLASCLIEKLPSIRKILLTDVEAAYSGDPAAESYYEVIYCYPIIKALSVYRVAHELLRMKVPLIPRIMTEIAHSETGIDIHPGAQIGTYFTIDHGTGVVIGATCIIGDHVKLYQGVTLGARSFPLDENGNPIKHIPRHPIIGNNVIVYSNSTILGRIRIGDGATIGGNVWLTHDVPAGETVHQTPCTQE